MHDTCISWSVKLSQAGAYLSPVWQLCRAALWVCDVQRAEVCLQTLVERIGFSRVDARQSVMYNVLQDVTEVVNTCHEAGISKLAVKLRPIAVIKG